MEFVFNASDLCPVTPLSKMGKYADDTYLMVPSVNTASISVEMEHIANWALNNNLTLNASKTRELIVQRPKGRGCVTIPSPTACIKRVESLCVLGVILQSNFSAREHVSKVVCRGSQCAFALRTLRAHGLQGAALWEVAGATLVASAAYDSQAWWGLVDTGGAQQLDGMLRRLVKQGLLPPSFPTFSEICDEADAKLFAKILNTPAHVLNQLLPPIRNSGYNMRPRAHNRVLPAANNNLMRKTFITRMLYMQ